MTPPDPGAGPVQQGLFDAPEARLRTTSGFAVADELPVASVQLIGVLPHLDRPFDYAVPATLAELGAGMRVKARLAGVEHDGFVLSRSATTETDRPLAPVHRLVSTDRVISTAMLEVCREVARRYGGTLGDVLRLAVPPRHARAEKADRAAAERETEARAGAGPEPVDGTDDAAASAPDADPHESGPARPGDRYRGLPALLTRAADGSQPVPRAAIVLDAADRWWDVAADAVADLPTQAGALVIAPDQRDLTRLATALDARGVDHEVLGHGDGPEKRYRAFRRILRGVSRVVIGNRSAAFAPVQDLRLAILVDGDDDLLVEPRAPYPHIRAVLQARSATEHCALLLLSSSLGTEVAMLARTGYLHLLEPVPQPPHEVRPQIRLMDEYLRSREGPSGSSRMPREALAVIRRGLEHGPVLVQVPRSGYLPAVACTFCGTRCRCPTCAAALVMDGGGGILHCPVCGKREDGYRCPECHRTHLRALVIGAGRTAEELGRAFPEADLVVAGGAQGPLADAQVPSRGIVVATPGAEPAYPGGSAGSDGTVDGDAPAEDPGFAAAVLLDADALPARAAYDADVEAVRRWRNAIALVRPARLGGEVLVVGTATLPAIRDLVAHRSGAFVERVLADRELLGLPPFTRVCELVGDRAAVRDYLSATSLPDGVEVFGPVDLPTDEDRITTRAVLRLPIGRSRELADAIRAGIAARTARKAPGSLRARLDPPDVF